MGCGTTSTVTTSPPAPTGSALAAALSTAYSEHTEHVASGEVASAFEVQRNLSRCQGEGTMWECTLHIGSPGWDSHFRVQLGEDRCFTANETGNPSPVVVNGCIR